MAQVPIFSGIRIIPRESDFLDRKSGSRGEVFFDRDVDTLRLYDGDSKGGISLARADLTNTSVNEFRSKLVESKQSTVVYTVTVVSPVSPDVGNKYRLNNVYKPELDFVIGYTYVFDQSDPTNVFYPNANGTTPNPHPLNFSADDPNGDLGNGTSYLGDVIYVLDGRIVSQTDYRSASFISASTRQVRITITNSTPNTLYYWCWNHLNMGNSAGIAEPGSGSGGGNTTVSVGASLPNNPTNGNLWLNTNNGNLYVYINDGDSNQWIQPATPTVDLSNYALSSQLASYALNSSLTDYVLTSTLNSTLNSTLSNYATLADLNNVPRELFEFNVASDDSTVRPISSGNTVKFIGAGGVTTSSDADGNITITGGGTTGDITFAGTTIDSSDSSAIAFVPAVTLQSDLTVENELFVQNTIFTGNINVTGTLTSTGSGTPEIVSDNEIFLTPGTTTILNGLTTFNQTTEVINTKTGATGVVDHDFSTGSLFLHTSLAANFTANIVNMPTTDNRSTSIALLLDQGATAYIPNAVQIDGAAQTIKWSGGSPPSGTNNYLDIVNFTLIRANNAWTVIGSLSTYN